MHQDHIMLLIMHVSKAYDDDDNMTIEYWDMQYSTNHLNVIKYIINM